MNGWGWQLDLVLISEQHPDSEEELDNHVLAVVDNINAEGGYGMVCLCATLPGADPAVRCCEFTWRMIFAAKSSRLSWRVLQAIEGSRAGCGWN